MLINSSGCFLTHNQVVTGSSPVGPPDYLGSVDLVTDRNGVAYEFFLYTPWGEDMYSYNSGTSNFTSPYRFNGKEKDPKTGYHYYGARYYQSKFSIWMSVDPLAHETLEPYVYTGNNPVMLVDPDGNDVILTGSLSSLTFTTLSKSAIAQGVKLSINSNGELSYVFSGNKSKLSPSMQTLLRGIIIQVYSSKFIQPNQIKQAKILDHGEGLF